MTKKKISVRIEDYVSKALDLLTKETPFNLTQHIELALLNYFDLWNDKLNSFNGINFQEIAELHRLKIIRNILGFKRNEFLSRELFPLRVKSDVLKMITYNQNKDHKQLKSMVLQYLNLRKQEAQHYKDNKILLEEINEMTEIADKRIGEMKQHISVTITDMKYISNAIKET